MATFGVTITSNTTPAIVVTLSGNTNYKEFKNSLGNYVYYVNRVYVYSQLLRQIQGGFNYSKYDSDGTQNLQTVLSTITPYQYQNSNYLELRDRNVVLDGRDYVRFKMYPNTSLQIKLYANRISNGDTFDRIGMNNFLMWQEVAQQDFFDDYKDLL